MESTNQGPSDRADDTSDDDHGSSNPGPGDHGHGGDHVHGSSNPGPADHDRNQPDAER
jgi:hypothetical protein